MCFNSTLVRLKERYDRTLFHQMPLFQFHSGSIKSGGSSPALQIARMWFQFHSGSIKSGSKRTI